MFIRLKKIKGNHYAYHVENRRADGKVKQKVKAYLGKAFLPEKTSQIDFFAHTQSDLSTASKKPYPQLIHQLIAWELYRHSLEGFSIDTHTSSIACNGEPAVVKLNEGFLCSHSLSQLLAFKLIRDEEHASGRLLAELFVKAGIAVPKELFVKMFEQFNASKNQE